jgi:hypothetical protein
VLGKLRKINREELQIASKVFNGLYNHTTLSAIHWHLRPNDWTRISTLPRLFWDKRGDR